LLSEYAAWQKLQSIYDKQHTSLKLKDLFNGPEGSKRFETFSRLYQSPSTGDRDQILVDYSKNLIDENTWSTLLDLAKEAKVPEFRDAMFKGEHINTSEGRAVLHVALRNVFPQAGEPFSIKEEGADEVKQVLDHMKEFTDAVRSGEWKGYTGQPIKTIVNIGIGGSDLGPVMVTEALKPYSKRDLKCKFVSNVDGSDIAEVLKECEAESTLFIVASKTFTTQETMTNAESARDWFLSSAKDVSSSERCMNRRKRQPSLTYMLEPACRRNTLPSTSSPLAPTPKPSPRSVSLLPTCSSSGTG